MTQKRLETRVVHAGLVPDPSYGSIIPAIHQTSTFVQKSVGEVVDNFDYSRAGNPTRSALEGALSEIESGHATVFSSGMAATHAVITAVAGSGDHVIIPDDLYGGTYRLVDKVLSRWGLSYTMVDQSEPANVRAALNGKTKLIWVETPTNPSLKVVDVAEIINVAGDVQVAVDNTFATPVHQQPLADGAAIVVHSTTKYLAGHSDSVGGAVIVADEDLHEKVRFIALSIGAVPGPFDCFLVHRGIRTLCLRMRQHQLNGEAVSSYLRSVDSVSDVRWPGFSGMVSFRHPDAVSIATQTKIFSLAESLGGVESLIEVPQAMTHASVEDSTAAVPPDMIRLSCGIEAGEDLVEDLKQALA